MQIRDLVDYGLKGRVALITGAKNPQGIAETILFLASEQAKIITGQVIKISGGHAL